MSIDIATAFNRYSFLGGEFLLWLWWASGNTPDTVNRVIFPNEKVTFEFAGGIAIENEKPKSKITIKSEDSGHMAAAIAISDGGRIKEICFGLSIGENDYSFSITSEDLSVKISKSPSAGPADAPDEIEGAVLEKIYLIQRLFECLDAIHREFIRIRVTAAWGNSTVPQILRWLSDTTGHLKPMQFQHEMFSPGGRPAAEPYEDSTDDHALLEDEKLEIAEETI